MALTFAKKAAGAGKAPSKTADEAETKSPSKTSTADKPKSGFGFLKTGAAAKQALAEEEAKAELAKQEAGKLWRFWMPAGEDRTITFLDGDVDEDGMLDIPMFHEHQVRINGNYENFICTSEQEGHCPICDKGDSKPYLVGVMTIIDHTPHKVKSGKNAGKIIKDTRKMFVAKKQTIRQLAKIAAKRGGLAGCTFDVSRADDKSASVGSQFDFVSKASLEDVAGKYELKLEDAMPADYQAELTYRTAEELVELGVGKAAGGIGHEKGVTDKKSLKNEL